MRIIFVALFLGLTLSGCATLPENTSTEAQPKRSSASVHSEHDHYSN